MAITGQSFTSIRSTAKQILWANRAMEALWLLVIVLTPLVVFGRTYGEWSSVIGSYELPKITVLRTGASLIAVLWLLKWALQSPGKPNSLNGNAQIGGWHRRLAPWLATQPVRWVTVAVFAFFSTTLLSTLLSTSYDVSLWGDVPGQDSYSAYTVACYGLIFAAIATHLKTEAQLWRLVGAVVLMGFLAGGYAVSQHYGGDFLGLVEPIGHSRSTSTFGGTIFAGAVLLMTIPITILAATKYLMGNISSREFVLGVAVGAIILGVQLLGTIFIASRGPWVGTAVGLAGLLVILASFSDWRTLGRAVLVLALGGLLTLVVLVSPLQSVADESVAESTSVPALDAKDVGQRIISVRGEISSGGLSGRKEIWDTTWDIVTERPWFSFDSLSLSPLRPLIGYGPEQFRGAYLLVSPPRPESDFLPQEVGHAHNYFLHQAVETGFLGLLSSVGTYLAVFVVGLYIWLRCRQSMTPTHKLVLAGLLAIMLGRFLEQMVGVARVSDLTVFWVLLAVFAALPNVFPATDSFDQANEPLSKERLSNPPRTTQPSPFLGDLWAPLKWASVAVLVIGIATLTWTKNVNYVRATVTLDDTAQDFKSGQTSGLLTSIGQSIDLSPEVSTYYQRWNQVHQAFPDTVSVADCPASGESKTNQLCMAQKSYVINSRWVEERPFDFRSRSALAASALDLSIRLGDAGLRDQSLLLFEQAGQMAPNSWALWNVLADAQISVNQPDLALESLAKSLSITGESSVFAADGLRLQGTAYRQQGRLEAAISSLNQAANLDSGSGAVFLDRSIVWYQLGQVDLALEDLEKASNFSVQTGPALYLRGRIYQEQGDYQAAITDFTGAIELDSQQPLTWNSRGLTLSSLGELAAAIDDFSEAIRLDPQLAAAYNNRGFARRDAGQLEESIRDLDQAIELDPGLVNAYYNRTLTNILLGNDAKAQSDADKAVELGYDAEALVAAINELENSVKP